MRRVNGDLAVRVGGGSALAFATMGCLGCLSAFPSNCPASVRLTIPYRCRGRLGTSATRTHPPSPRRRRRWAPPGPNLIPWPCAADSTPTPLPIITLPPLSPVLRCLRRRRCGCSRVAPTVSAPTPLPGPLGLPLSRPRPVPTQPRPLLLVADEFLLIACDGIWDVMSNDVSGGEGGRGDALLL